MKLFSESLQVPPIKPKLQSKSVKPKNLKSKPKKPRVLQKSIDEMNAMTPAEITNKIEMNQMSSDPHKSKPSKKNKFEKQSKTSSGTTSNISTTGTKKQVWNDQAKKTSGGLTKKDLMVNKHGKVISIKQYNAGLKALENLNKMKN